MQREFTGDISPCGGEFLSRRLVSLQITVEGTSVYIVRHQQSSIWLQESINRQEAMTEVARDPRMGVVGYQVKGLAASEVVPEKFVQSEAVQNAFTPHNEAPKGSVPVVDLGGLQDESRRGAILAAIASACEEWGFFQIVNYGIPPSLVQKTHNLAREFFDLPQEEKEALARDFTNPVSNGYGRQFRNFKVPTPEDWQDLYLHYLLPLSLKQKDTWPQKPAAYRETMEEYGAEVLKLTDRLLDVFGELLGLKRGYLQEICGETILNVRLNYYAACPNPNQVLGLRAHSDPNLMTVLAQDQVGGLQVKKGHEWSNVISIPGALVINLGDQMQILSNGRFQSVEHRVVTNQGADRLSLAMFRHPSEDAVIGPAPELVNDSHPAKYSAISYNAYRAQYHSSHSKGKDGKAVEDTVRQSRA